MSKLPWIVVHNVAAMRAYADRNAEQVSQLIMGDTALPLDESGEFSRVRGADEYEGWILTRHLRRPTPNDRFWIDGEPAERISYVVAPIAELNDLSARLVFGTRIERVPDEGPVHPGAAVRLANGQSGYVGEEVLTPQGRKIAFRGAYVADLARRFIGTPYLWGGTTPFGFDCSGFVQRLYAFHGVLLPRDAYQQAAGPLGTRLESDQELRAGDLLFFRGASDPLGRGVAHVGIALDDHRFIHASGADGVVITPIDDPHYQPLFHSARRYPPDP